MERIKIEPKLELFLREERVLTKFKKNFLAQNKDTDMNRVVDDISSAFLFEPTPEGFNYWAILFARHNRKKYSS